MAYELVSLNHLSTFESVAEMNETIKQYNRELTRSQYETLRLLSQYSVKVVGVSHLKIETIANKLNKSIRTIKRHIAYLKANGYISIINTYRRKTGGQGANAYVINTLDYCKKIRKKNKNVTAQMSPRAASKNDGQSLRTKALEVVKIRKETINSLNLYIKSLCTSKASKKHKIIARINRIKNVRQCPSNVDVYTYKTNAPFFSDDQIAIMYKTINKQIDVLGNVTDEQRQQIIDNAFNSTVKALRRYHNNEGQRIKNIYAYASKVAKTQTLRHVTNNAFNFLFD